MGKIAGEDLGLTRFTAKGTQKFTILLWLYTKTADRAKHASFDVRRGFPILFVLSFIYGHSTERHKKLRS